MSRTDAAHPRKTSREPSRAMARFYSATSSLAGVLLTLFGLVLLTFLIGRTMPIDPVVAIVGDKSPAEVFEKLRLDLCFD